jgi:flagellar basal-body rod protein FlgG
VAGLIELGEIMVVGAQRRLETASHNVANLTTPGYRKGVAFHETLANEATANGNSFSTDFTTGALRATGQPFDLALSSEGFFCIRGDNGVYYTRSGQFARDAEGRIVDGRGFVLQTADGQDLVVGAQNVEILADGVVLEGGVPVARIGVFATAPQSRLERIGGAYFSAPPDGMHDVASPLVRQGMLEGSNVDLPAEMLMVMSAMRQAEVGARVVQTYDSLIGQTISTLGRMQA